MAAEARRDPHDRFPKGFFSRTDEIDDSEFYRSERFVTHIDDRAIAAVGELYTELGLTGSVLDLMSSWVSHFRIRPAELVALGMNRRELEANPMADEVVVQDLNRTPALPFGDDRFDAVTCCVSVDYLIRPIDVLVEAARVVRPGGPVVCTFSNRCFPTKVIRGWLLIDEPTRCRVVAEYMRLAGLVDPAISLRTHNDGMGDPLYAVIAKVA
jgi:SAM-dependent methyltransferase